MHEFNTAGKIEALTEKQGRFILKQPGLDALRNRIIEEGQGEGISSDAWALQAPVSKKEMTLLNQLAYYCEKTFKTG